MFALMHPYDILVLSSVVVPATLAVIVLRQRSNLGARSFSALMASVALWAFVAMFEVYTQDQATKIFSYKIKFLFIVIIPVAWLAFSLYYANRIRRLPLRQLVLLLIVPAVTLTMVATNPLHHWMFTRFETVVIDPYRLLFPHFGPYFWLHVAYSYSLLLIGVIALAKPLLGSPAHYRRQVISLLVGGMTPWLANILFIFKIGRLPYFDLTPIAFTISGIAFMWGILRYRLLEVVPIARDVVIQNMSDGMIIVDHEESIIDLNEKARALSGIDAVNVIGTRAADMIPWWSRARTMLAHDQDTTVSILELETGGRSQWFQLTFSPLVVKSKSLGELVTLHDVTAIHAAEMALRDSEERFKSLSENAPVIIFSLNENGALDYVNPAWTQLLGHDRDTVLGRPFTDFIDNDGDQNVAGVFDQLIDGRMTSAELNFEVIHQKGTRLLFNTSAAANSNVEGRVTGIIGLAKDITEERKLQQQLFQSQKMEAVGTLAGGIAHDFNNLLMGMQANLSLIRLESNGNRSIKDKLMRVEEQIHSGASLTRQLLGYARKGKYTVSVFDLNDLVKSTLNIVHRTNKQINVVSRLGRKCAYMRGDRGQMELVLLNLLLNAVDAMPSGGDLTVSTEQVNDGQPAPAGSAGDESAFVRLEVKDTGIGMDRATQDRIFEPFFTTKEIGRGTGLGLASVYGIVQNHEGRIQVQSSPGEGSTFTLLLPASKQGRRSLTAKDRGNVRPMTEGKVLLVDDEPLILKYCSEMIVSLGFSVVSTQHSREAVDLFKQQAHDIDLVILDLIMPQMDGLQLFKVLEEINPRIRALFTTGYAVDNRISELVAGGRHGCLRKPYGRAELSNMINALLAPNAMRISAERTDPIDPGQYPN